MDDKFFKLLTEGARLLDTYHSPQTQKLLESGQYPHASEIAGALSQFSEHYGSGIFSDAIKKSHGSLAEALGVMVSATAERSRLSNTLQSGRLENERKEQHEQPEEQRRHQKQHSPAAHASSHTPTEDPRIGKQFAHSTLNQIFTVASIEQTNNGEFAIMRAPSGQLVRISTKDLGSSTGPWKLSPTIKPADKNAKPVVPASPPPQGMSTTQLFNRMVQPNAVNPAKPAPIVFNVGTEFVNSAKEVYVLEGFEKAGSETVARLRGPQGQIVRIHTNALKQTWSAWKIRRTTAAKVTPAAVPPQSATIDQPVAYFNSDKPDNSFYRKGILGAKMAQSVASPAVRAELSEGLKNAGSAGSVWWTRSRDRIGNGIKGFAGNLGAGVSNTIMPGSAAPARGAFSLPNRPGSGMGSAVNGVSNTINTINNVRKYAALAGRLAPIIFNPITLGILILLGVFLFFNYTQSLKVDSFCGYPWENKCVAGFGPGENIPSIFVRLDKKCPLTSTVETPFTCDLTATYLGYGTAVLELKDKIPDNTVFVSASNDVTPNDHGELVWRIENIGYGESQHFQMTVHPTTDAWIKNTATLTVISSTFSGAPPNQDNCGGRYTLNNPLGNFGDPGCNFDENESYQLWRQLDPSDADFWFYTVEKCESGYNPNAYADPIKIGTPDSAGAWGLVQMGRGKNGQFDHGDVEWHLQTSNAVNYQNTVIPNHPWNYWQCAKSRWR